MRMFRRLWLKLLVVVLVSSFLLAMGSGGSAAPVEAAGPCSWKLLGQGLGNLGQGALATCEGAVWLANKRFGAEDARTEDMVGCWVTGELGSDDEGSWHGVGKGKDEFALEVGDGYNAAVRKIDQRFIYEPRKHKNFFRSVGDLIDYTFGLSLLGSGGDFQHVDDDRVREVEELVLGGGDLGDSRKVPWKKRAEYMARRPVAQWGGNRLKSFSKRWMDPDNPEGGTSVDFAEMSRDLVAGQADLAVSTTTMMGQGGETTFAQAQVPVLLLESSNVGVSCVGVDGTTTCDSSQDVRTVPDVVQVRRAEYEYNTDEVEERNLDLGERPVIVGDSEESETLAIDTRAYGPSQVVSRSGSIVGYGREGARDLGDTGLRIEVELDPDLRADFKWATGGGPKAPANVNVPGFGWNEWTYEKIGQGRDWRVNSVGSTSSEEGVGVPAPGDSEEAPPGPNAVIKDVNSGYRQPMLNRFVGTSGEAGDVRANMEHVKWPVNFEDMNWYMYEVPGDPGTSLFYYWLSLDGGRRLAWSGYGNTALAGAFDPGCTLTGVPNEQKNVKCDDDKVPEWDKDLKDLVAGDEDEVYFPFDVGSADIGDASTGLRRSMLMRAGVASPEDQGAGPGTVMRKLSRFSFDISEGSDARDVERRGSDGLRRLGIPEDEALARTMLDEWPDGGLNPNGIYLLVVTFYESRRDGRLEFVLKKQDGTAVDGSPHGIYMPRREVRRVVCRIIVRHSGFQASGTRGTSALDVVTGKVRDILTDVGQDIRRLAADGMRGLMKSPPWAGRKMADVECSGMALVDNLTVGGPATSKERVGGGTGEVDIDAEEELVRKVGEGELVVNQALVGKYNGIEECERVKEERKVTCDTSVEFIFQGRCTELPKMDMKVRGGKFVDLQERVLYSRYEWGYEDERGVIHREPQPVRHDGWFSPTLGPEGLQRPNDRNRGVSRLYVGWEPKWEGLYDDLVRHVDGWKIVAIPDQRSMERPVAPEGEVFHLPRLILVEQNTFGEGGSVITRSYHTVDGFHFGALGVDEQGDPRTGDQFWPLNDGVVDPDDTYGVYAVGGEDIQAEYRRFNSFLKRLPLAPGYSHSFSVYPFVGEYGTTSYQPGTSGSNILVIDGEKAACETSLDTPGTLPGTFELHPKVEGIYGCGNVGANEAPLSERRPFGLLSLLGTEACGDIFSSTPAAFTWDNKTVRRSWVLMVVVGGAVLLTVLVWTGLRMTYDVWLEPQPAMGVRELVPRFLLAVVLMAGSLAICELVLVLASDITCFIAQATGMTMWGFLGTTIGSMLGGFVAWVDAFNWSLDGMYLSAMLGWGLVLFVVAVIVVVFVILVLILFLMVAFAMLTRIALLAVLIVFSPLAFAFYASNATSHWTKKWVSMFLGTAFQQVVVLMVVFLGGNILGTYMKQGAQGELDVMIIGLILAALTLVLALKVPGIVNPTGQGMFQGFSQIGQMALGGAMMIGSMGVGAAMGAFGGAAGAASGGGASRMRMRGTGGGGGGDSGGDDGGGAGGAPVGAGGPRSSGPGSPSSSGGGVSRGGGLSSGSFPGGPGSTGPAGSSTGSGTGSAGGGAAGGSTSEKKPGFLQRTYQGARRGTRFAGGVNTRMADLSSGRFLYRGGSTADDSALEVSRLRREQSARAGEQSEAYDRMASVLDKLNQKLP